MKLRSPQETPIPPSEITPEMLKAVADAAAQQASRSTLNSAGTALVGTWMGIGTVLAIRLLLLLTLCGGFVLAVMAMRSQTTIALGVMIAYSILVILPMVYLSRFKGTGDAG
ncbi:MAG: hypothetical protein KGL39_43995 [Patescibacteria group bacterium]|nr:hypothetical protein [Patescibacteria group bacterium]